MEIHESLNDPNFFAVADYHAALRELRHNDPLHWGLGRHGWGFWSITRYVDCQAVYRNPETFCSSRGIALPTNPPEEERAAQELGGNAMMISSTPTPHQGAAGVQEMVHAAGHTGDGGGLSAIAPELIDAVADAGCDLVADLAAQMPTAVICQIWRCPNPIGII